MRNVAVTEGDKVEAQIKFGWEVDAYPVNATAAYVKDVAKGDVDALVDDKNQPIASGGHEWENRYENGVWTYSLDDIWTGIQAVSYTHLSKTS